MYSIINMLCSLLWHVVHLNSSLMPIGCPSKTTLLCKQCVAMGSRVPLGIFTPYCIVGSRVECMHVCSSSINCAHIHAPAVPYVSTYVCMYLGMYAIYMYASLVSVLCSTVLLLWRVPHFPIIHLHWCSN